MEVVRSLKHELDCKPVFERHNEKDSFAGEPRITDRGVELSCRTFLTDLEGRRYFSPRPEKKVENAPVVGSSFELIELRSAPAISLKKVSSPVT
eukprot:CAMPEP_0174746002 /NCGR_PEP_ID=MMETSP1094-20130205/88091_1 /TAXON_ID=156173 /ORGANISM="Chrysochromulina brevifilum, Strain UTEX LB 985" /LENGTH=93 /DNA_ID=CAMNT_0015950639 /DNA_START=111 /DNA_END=388 /DNA_ORIENTATION=+